MAAARKCWMPPASMSVWPGAAACSAKRCAMNGCLKLLPGSHRGSVIHDGDMSDGAGFGHRIRPETVDESVAITAPVEAGGAVFFHDLTMHSSHPNTERRERWTWVPTYRDGQADDPHYSFAVANAVVRGVGRE